jgi:hypothetical protein
MRPPMFTRYFPLGRALKRFGGMRIKAEPRLGQDAPSFWHSAA